MVGESLDPVMKMTLDPTVSMDGDGRIDPVRLAFQPHIHQYHLGAEPVRERDGGSGGLGDAADFDLHVFEDHAPQLGDEYLVIDNQDAVSQAVHRGIGGLDDHRGAASLFAPAGWPPRAARGASPVGK